MPVVPSQQSEDGGVGLVGALQPGKAIKESRAQAAVLAQSPATFSNGNHQSTNKPELKPSSTGKAPEQPVSHTECTSFQKLTKAQGGDEVLSYSNKLSYNQGRPSHLRASHISNGERVEMPRSCSSNEDPASKQTDKDDYKARLPVGTNAQARHFVTQAGDHKNVRLSEPFHLTTQARRDAQAAY
jgi:hypothetical protein